MKNRYRTDQKAYDNTRRRLLVGYKRHPSHLRESNRCIAASAEQFQVYHICEDKISAKGPGDLPPAAVNETRLPIELDSKMIDRRISAFEAGPVASDPCLDLEFIPALH